MAADDFEADYRDAGFSGSLTPGRSPVLLLIDFVRAYFDDTCGLYARVEAERATASDLARAARRANIPVVFTRVEYEPGDPLRDGGLFYRKVPALAAFDRGNPLGNFTDALRPEAGDIVITKQYPSAFFATDLTSRLRALGVDTCLIAGLTTSGCVRATTLDALCHGFIPFVVREACGDRSDAIHAANLFDIGAKYAEVIDAAAATIYLESLANA